MSDKEDVIREWIEGVIKSGAEVSAQNDLDQGEINNLFRELADKYPKQAYTANESAAEAIGEQLNQMNLAGTITTQPEKFRALSKRLEEVTSHLDQTTGAP